MRSESTTPPPFVMRRKGTGLESAHVRGAPEKQLGCRGDQVKPAEPVEEDEGKLTLPTVHRRR